MSVVLAILEPGLQTTVQDRGRFGSQALGVPVSGALDPDSMRIANALVRNPPDAAVLEMRFTGAAFRVEGGPARIAVAGVTAQVTVEAGGEIRTATSWRSIDVPDEGTVRIGAFTGSATATVAIAGGIDVPLVSGSRSTYLRGGFGGHEGRALVVGDRLPVGSASVSEPCLMLARPPRLDQDVTLRVVPGPQADWFAEPGTAAFFSGAYRVTADVDRMGMRLEGPEIAHRDSYNIVSDGITTGAIQVPGSRQPILLLADRQTTGGYPKIATVVSADLSLAGRLAPGACVAFRAVTVDEAEDAARAREAALARFIAIMEPARDSPAIDLEALHRENLISGVIGASE